MILVGDVFDRLCDIEPQSIQAVITSPPYYRLRDYEVEGQLGQEATVEEYVENLATVGDMLAPLLTPTGTYWLNIGDSYGDKGMRLAPHRLAIEMQSRGWFVHCDVVWRKTRYMPNGGKSRPVLIHEYVFMFSRQRSGHYYNPDAIREPHSPVSLKRWKASGVAALGAPHSMGHKQADGGYKTKTVVANPLGKLKASVWDICPSNYPGAHFAVMPEKLAETCLLASTQPGDRVFDPFAGSGTTGVVAKRHHRLFTGIELDPDAAALAITRIEETIK